MSFRFDLVELGDDSYGRLLKLNWKEEIFVISIIKVVRLLYYALVGVVDDVLLEAVRELRILSLFAWNKVNFSFTFLPKSDLEV
jgi:hypothetical protein